MYVRRSVSATYTSENGAGKHWGLPLVLDKQESPGKYAHGLYVTSWMRRWIPTTVQYDTVFTPFLGNMAAWQGGTLSS